LAIAGKTYSAAAADLGLSKGQLAGRIYRERGHDHNVAMGMRDSRSPLAKFPGGDLLLAIFLHSKTRMTLKRLSETMRNGAWNFLVDCHRDLGPEPTQEAILVPNLRLVFPWLKSSHGGFATRFDITRAEDRRQIKDEIIPTVRAHMAELRAQPDRLAQLLDAARKAKRTSQVIEFQRPAIERARREMAADEQEIVFHGKRLWPLAEHEKQFSGPDYQTLCHAIWWVNDALKIMQLPDPRPKDLGQGIRWMTRFLIEWAATREPAVVRDEIVRFAQLLVDLSVMYQNADGVGDCKVPHAPLRIKGASASIGS
jgi:hypothetical protein